MLVQLKVKQIIAIYVSVAYKVAGINDLVLFITIDVDVSEVSVDFDSNWNRFVYFVDDLNLSYIAILVHYYFLFNDLIKTPPTKFDLVVF